MTINQTKLFEILDDNGWDVFSHQMLIEEGTFNATNLWSILRYLTKNGSIVKIEKGKYRRRSFKDDNVIACFLAEDACIAYWTALNMHGLTEQITNVVFIQNSQRFGKMNIPGFGGTFNLIKVKPEKISGHQTRGYGNHIWRITDVEKTIVDCFDLPQYAGGYPEIIKGFAKAKLKANKLIKYCKNINNHSVTRRLAYLCELLNKPDIEKFIQYALTQVNNSCILFENGIGKTNKINKKWRIYMNISETEIQEIANDIY